MTLDRARKTRRACLLAALPLLLPVPLAAQGGYPARPITLVVPFAPGGIADITARAVAEAMGASLKQTVVVDNRPSAGGIVGSAAVAKAAPDGYTLLLMSNANAVSASLFGKLSFDVLRDFAPVTTLGYFDLALFVGSQSRFRSLAEVLGHARAQPGELTIGTISVGSTQQLAAELFRIRTGIDALIVPYKGTPAVLTALRAGEIDLAFEILGPMLPQLEAGVVRALAVTSERRFTALPMVPTAQEAGVRDYVVSSWNALAVPSGTPAGVVDTLRQAATAALASAPVRERLTRLGVRPQASTPEQLQRLLASEIERWREVIRAAKIPTQ
jgi:tripartite-type tricarboxylate transporter receptor subunit TctC